MSHDLFLTRNEILSNIKTVVQYPASLVSGATYRASQAFQRANHPIQQTLQRGDFDITWKKDAHLAKAAYTSSPVEGYTIDPEFSYGNTTVYKNNQTGKATVAFAGTRGIKDARADLAIVAGMEQKDPQFQQALQTTKNVISKYGKDNVHITGHSLGGAKSSYVSSKLGVKGTTFNQGWFGGAITHATNIGDKWDTSNVKDYVVPGDPISAATMITAGRNVTKIPQEEKLEKLKGMFKMKGMEGMARTSIPEMVAPIPYVGQAAALAYTGYGAYELGKRSYDLHKMDNFIQPTRPVSAKTQQDRVNTEKDRVRTETSLPPVRHPEMKRVKQESIPVVPGVSPAPLTYDEQSRVNMPVLLSPGFSYGDNRSYKLANRKHKKTKASKRRHRHAIGR